MELLIVGANAAGLAAALEARRRNSRCRITVVDAATDISWSTCDLPYSLTGGRDPEDLILRRPADFLARDIRVLVEHPVQKVDLARGTVSGTGPFGREFELDWDRLVLCSGVQTRPLTDLHGRPVALPGARSLQDARALAAALPGAARVVIVGAGPIGLELADCLRAPGRELHLVEAGPRPLADWPGFAGLAVTEVLAREGVTLHAGSPVLAVEPAGGRYRVHIDGGPVLEAELVINASGVLPARGYLEPGLLAEDARGYLDVDARMRTSDSRVYAAGDLVLRRSCVDGRLFPGGLALDARRGGRVAGANAASPPDAPPLALPPGPGTLALVVCGLELARTGHPGRPEEDSTPGNDKGFAGFLQEGDSAASAKPPTLVSPAGPGLLGADSRPAPGTAVPHGEGQVAVVRRSYPLSGHRGDRRRLHLQLECTADGRLRAATLVTEGPGSLRIDVVAALLASGAGWRELEALDLAYTPPLGPAVDPLIQAARSLGELLAGTPTREGTAG